MNHISARISELDFFSNEPLGSGICDRFPF
jgi:hypothetical protein